MKITKFGHCCLLLDINGVRILTDPAMFSKGHETVTNIDIVLISHEHQDHFHLDALKVILANNPQAKVITNSSVSKLMFGIRAIVVGDKQNHTEKDILFEGIGTKHAPIYGDYPPTENTGYFIANKLFYPGDAFTLPGKPTEVLALPVAGPWMKLSEAIDYAKAVDPKFCFPVHDGISLLPMGQFLLPFFGKLNVQFKDTPIGMEVEF